MPTFKNIVRSRLKYEKSAIYIVRMICLKGFKKYQRAFFYQAASNGPCRENF